MGDVLNLSPDFIKGALDRALEVLASKGSDYSRGSVDPFVNFKETAAIAGISPAHVALVLCGIKMSRIRHLEGAGKPENESLADSYIDLMCYAVLAYAMRSEEEFNNA